MQVRLLGELALEVSGRLVRVPSERRRALLASLALAPGDAVSVDRLVDHLWGDKPPDNAVPTLHAHVSYLRRLLRDAGVQSEVLQTRRPGYALLIEPRAVDVHRFEQGADAGRRLLQRGELVAAADTLLAALDEWRGRFLADLPDAAFAVATGARLDERLASATEDWADAMLTLGRHGEVSDRLPAAVRRHPLHERLHCQLMLSLYRNGRQADALRVYQQLRTTMAEELGIEPSPEIRRLEESILLQKSELDWVPPDAVEETRGPQGGPLPLPTTSFVGRQGELEATIETVARPGLLTVMGPAGCGKTRLALEAAARVAATRPVWLVEFGPVSAGTDLWSVVAGALEVREQPGVHVATGIVEHLRGEGGFVVLDNCEHVRDPAAGLVAELINEVPDLTILATSQRPLGVHAERVRTLAPLDVGPAMQLFADRSRRARSGFVLDESNRDSVSDVCFVLDGLPLAIELAAARMNTLDPAQLLARLGDAVGFLASRVGDTTRPPRHQTLRAALEWGHGLLTDDEQVLFRRLSVFPGGLRLEDAERVCRERPLDRGDIYDVLDRLVNASMAVVDDRRGSVRFRLLEPVRQLAAEQLASVPEEERAVWSAQLENLTEYAGELLRRSPPAVAQLYVEIDNVRAALAFAFQSPGAELAGLELVLTLQQMFLLHGSHAEGQSLTLAAIAANASAPKAKLAAAHLSAGGLAQQRGRLDDATVHLDEALATAIESGDENLVARARFSRGNLAHHLGDPAAVDVLRPVADYARTAGDDDLLMRVLNSLGVIARRRGDLSEADSIIEESVAVARRLGDTMATVICLLNLGNVRQVAGDAEDARRRYEEALALARDTGWARGIAVACGSLGGIEPDPDKAVALYRESLDQAREVNDRPTMATTLINLGRALIRAGEVLDARAAFEEARTLSDQLGDPRGAAGIDHELALLARQSGDQSRARRYLAAALERRTELGDFDRMVEGVEAAAGVFLDAGAGELATRLLGAAAASRETHNLHRDPGDQEGWQSDVDAARLVLGDTFEACFAEGRTLDLNDAVRSTLEELTRVGLT